jgi:hypothetical protein
VKQTLQMPAQVSVFWLEDRFTATDPPEAMAGCFIALSSTF